MCTMYMLPEQFFFNMIKARNKEPLRVNKLSNLNRSLVIKLMTYQLFHFITQVFKTIEKTLVCKTFSQLTLKKNMLQVKVVGPEGKEDFAGLHFPIIFSSEVTNNPINIKTFA